MLFAVIIGLATNVGWAQTTVKDVSELLKALEDENVSSVQLQEGIYELTSPLVINKAFSVTGIDTVKTIIKGQIDVSRENEESTISINFQNLKIENASTLSQGVINVMSSNVDLNLKGVKLHQLTRGTNDGWGKSSTGIALLGKGYNSNAVCDNVNISLDNSMIMLEGNYNRGISSFGGTGISYVKNSVVLDNSKICSVLYPKNTTYSRGISLSYMDGSTIELKNKSSITGFYYAVNITMTNKNLKIKFDNSSIDSWAALNIWSSSNNIDILNSSLVSRNLHPKGSNDFATIVLNKDADANATDNVINIKGSQIIGKMENTAYQYPISVRSTGNTFNIGEGTTLSVDKDMPGYLIQENTYGSNIFNIDNTVKFRGEGDKEAIIIYKSDGSFGNAALGINGILLALEDGNTVVLPNPMSEEDFLKATEGSQAGLPNGAYIQNGDTYYATDVEIGKLLQNQGKSVKILSKVDDVFALSILPKVVNNTLYVSATGTGDGSSMEKALPGTMLQDAINMEGVGEVKLAAGTYQGHFVMKEGVNVTGTFGENDSTILDGGANGRVVSQKSATAKYTGEWQTEYAFGKETVWKNLIIRNGKLTDADKGIYGAAAGAFLSENGVLENCVIRDNVTEGTGIKAGGVLLDSGGCLQNCTIEGNKACDSYAGVMILAAGTVQSCIIRNNVITSNEHTAGIGSRNADTSASLSGSKASILIDGCDIYQNYTNGATAGAAGVNLNNTKESIVIKNSKIHDNADLVNGSRSGLCTGYAENMNSINITNCLIYNNGNGSNVSQNGIIASSGTNILNCTIWDNAGEHSGIYAIESGNPVITTTNTIAQDYYGKLHNNESVTLSRHVITYSLIPTVRTELLAEGNGQGNIIGAITTKMFTDSIQGNYLPVSGAPYIDKGIIGSWKSSDKDLAGVSRIQGSNIDMGAYESNLSADAKPVKITSMPDVISFGDTIRLFSNYKNVKYEFETNADGVLGWNISGKDTSVVALKPGTATLKVSTTTETPNISSLLVVTVERKTISVNTICLSVDSVGYGSIVDNAVTVNKTDENLFNGLVKEHEDVALQDLTGLVSSLNASQQVPVSVTATLSGNDASFYVLAPINNIMMKIGHKKLTVTARAKDRKYGESNPDFEVDYSNEFAYGETKDVLGGELKFACAATKESLAGTYDIEPYGYTSSNYKIEYVNSKLTVNSIAPKVELVSAVIDSTSKDKVILTGKLVHKGGHSADTEVKVGFNQGETAITSALPAMKEAGTFTLTTNALDNATYTYTATAQIGEGTKVTSAPQSVEINKEYTVQTIQFATQIGKVEYGSKPIELAAVSDQEKATGDYTYKVESGNDVVKVEGKTLTILKTGTATISVSRPADGTNRFTAASALQTIEVVKKPVRIVNKSVITKSYDNTLDAAINITDLKVVDAAGQNVPEVSLTGSLTGKYADKNVGNNKKIVISGVSISDEANYELLGYNVTGNITKADLSISITGATRKYNETRAHYTLEYTGFKGTDNENTPGIHTGTIQVVENDNELSIPTDGISFPNYNLTTGTATVKIEKGTPKVVTYSAGSNVLGTVVDSAGWKVKLGDATQINDNNQAFAIYEDESGNEQTVYGTKLFGGGTPVTITPSGVLTRAVAEGLTTYGQRMKITFTQGASIESTDPGILKIIEMGENEGKGTATIEAVGIGKAAIVAVASDNNGANLLEATIKPCPIKVAIDGSVTKVYDGTNAASVVSLKATGVYAGDDVSLSYSTFTYNDKNAGSSIGLTPSRTIGLTGTKAVNYEIETVSLQGSITQRTLDVKSVTKEYNGKSSDDAVTSYQADGLVEGDVVPLKVEWGSDVNAGDSKNVTVSLPEGSNYELASSTSVPITGTITQARIVATMGAMEVSSATADAFKAALKKSDFFTLAATGEKFSIQNLSGYEPAITFGNGTFNVSGGDTQNYTFVYAKGDGTYTVKSSGGGSTTISVESVSLDKSELTLPRQNTYTLKATINPDNATNQKVTWKSSDEKIAKVDANGKVTAVAVGKATITVTTEDGGKTATCEVTVDFATGLEEAIANTAVYGKNGQIVIEPLTPMPVMIVNMMGKVVYNSRINGMTYVPAATGIYVVKLGTDSNVLIRKVNVR